MRILLIEDDARLAEHTAEYLQGHNAQVEIVPDGTLGLERAAAGEHDVVLLDLMLPGIDGLQLCKELRQNSGVPVIMLSARGEEVDRIVGLEIGADDYLPKPYSPRELLARIRAVLRRGQTTEVEGEKIERAGLSIDRGRREASFHGSKMELTAYQFDLLWALATRPGKVIKRADLFAEVRRLRDEPPQEFDPSVDRSIDVHLSKVRQALGRASSDGDKVIRTVRGVGYVLDLEALELSAAPN